MGRINAFITMSLSGMALRGAGQATADEKDFGDGFAHDAGFQSATADFLTVFAKDFPNNLPNAFLAPLLGGDGAAGHGGNEATLHFVGDGFVGD
jgi:hypothetical protein